MLISDNKTQEDIMRTTQLVYNLQAGKMVCKHTYTPGECASVFFKL